MRVFLKLCSFIFFIIITAGTTFPCTTAIISGKYTKDGRPLLYKHRDSGFSQNKLVYFSGGKYPFIGLVNTEDEESKEVWSGCNSKGFAIMNSASYNLKPTDDTTELVDMEGIVMKKALETCSSVDDFEELLKNWKKPIGVEANFGVIDAFGGAAYFECNNFSYTKIDANNPAIAPFGFIIRTNYSFTGSDDNGYGYIRYLTAENLFYEAKASNNLDYKFLLQDVSRSLRHSLLDIDLKKDVDAGRVNNEFTYFEDFIPRQSSVAVMVVRGVKSGESPEFATIWTALGFPLASIALPAWVSAGEMMPKSLISIKNFPSELCDISLKIKDKCFPVKRGSGKKYLNLNAVYNAKGVGSIQQIEPLEEEIFKKTEEKLIDWQRKKHIPKEEARRFCETIDYSAVNTLNKILLELE